MSCGPELRYTMMQVLLLCQEYCVMNYDEGQMLSGPELCYALMQILRFGTMSCHEHEAVNESFSLAQASSDSIIGFRPVLEKQRCYPFWRLWMKCARYRNILSRPVYEAQRQRMFNTKYLYDESSSRSCIGCWHIESGCYQSVHRPMLMQLKRRRTKIQPTLRRTSYII